MEARAQVFVDLKTKDMKGAINVLSTKYKEVRDMGEFIRVFDENEPENIVKFLIENDHIVSDIKKNKVGLEEYYIELMSKKEAKK